MNDLAIRPTDEQMVTVLQSSLYPGAASTSVHLVLEYCRAAGLDPMQKPVHIVPMWDRESGRMRDVIMPGIGLYRIQAARSGSLAGVSEPEFGPDVTEVIGGQSVTYPAWCRVSVQRRLPTGEIAAFTAREFWKENYAVKGGKEKSIAPNAMWTKRPYGQIAKCAQAQALRIAFPEIGAAPTAEEMEGRALTVEAADAEVSISEQVVEPVRARESGDPDKQPDLDPTPAATKPGPGVPQGMVRVLKARMEATAKTEDDLRAKFGHGFEGVSIANVNTLMQWASAR